MLVTDDLDNTRAISYIGSAKTWKPLDRKSRPLDREGQKTWDQTERDRKWRDQHRQLCDLVAGRVPSPKPPGTGSQETRSRKDRRRLKRKALGIQRGDQSSNQRHKADKRVGDTPTSLVTQRPRAGRFPIPRTDPFDRRLLQLAREAKIFSNSANPVHPDALYTWGAEPEVHTPLEPFPSDHTAPCRSSTHRLSSDRSPPPPEDPVSYRPPSEGLPLCIPPLDSPRRCPPPQVTPPQLAPNRYIPHTCPPSRCSPNRYSPDRYHRSHPECASHQGRFEYPEDSEYPHQSPPEYTQHPERPHQGYSQYSESIPTAQYNSGDSHHLPEFQQAVYVRREEVQFSPRLVSHTSSRKRRWHA